MPNNVRVAVDLVLDNGEPFTGTATVGIDVDGSDVLVGLEDADGNEIDTPPLTTAQWFAIQREATKDWRAIRDLRDEEHPGADDYGRARGWWR